MLYEIGKEINNENKLNPAVLIVANLEGNAPLGAEAALYLAESILGERAHYGNLTWFILLRAILMQPNDFSQSLYTKIQGMILPLTMIWMTRPMKMCLVAPMSD